MAYEPGDDIVTTVKWRRRSDRTLVEPGAFQVLVRPPQDVSNPLPDETVVGDAAGAYVTTTKVADGHHEFLLSTDRAEPKHSGRWKLWVTSTGAGKASRSHFIHVEQPPIG